MQFNCIHFIFVTHDSNHRLKKNYTYEFKLRELKFKKTFEQKDQLIIEVNTEYSKILEQEIRKYPEQYFWFHKKWDKKIYK